MNERLTWEEIKEKYPHKWVLMDDVEFEEDYSNYKSAIVLNSMDDFDFDLKNKSLLTATQYYAYTTIGDGRVKTMWGYI